MSTDVTLFETTQFSLSSTDTSQGEDDDLLVYMVSLPVLTLSHAPILTAPTLVSIKPPITQVYSWRQNASVSSPTPATLSSNPFQIDDIQITFRKGKRQCTHPISSVVSYNHLSSSLVPLLHP